MLHINEKTLNPKACPLCVQLAQQADEDEGQKHEGTALGFLSYTFQPVSINRQHDYIILP